MNKSNTQKTSRKINVWTNKAIFLDRDWTINKDLSYVYKISDLKLLDWAKEWLVKLKSLWYKSVIVSENFVYFQGQIFIFFFLILA